ncbi:uncharacterized protein [Ptychodera flava]|uniref:uncharacterized protein n=1 Tax=Ptychodera flava TaxID=63121 RepID=UPI00396A9839
MVSVKSCALVFLLCTSTHTCAQQQFSGTGKCTSDFQCITGQFCLKGAGTCEKCSAFSKADSPTKCKEDQLTATYGGCRDDRECGYGFWCFEMKCVHCDTLLDVLDEYKDRCGGYTSTKVTKAIHVDDYTAKNDVGAHVTYQSSADMTMELPKQTHSDVYGQHRDDSKSGNVVLIAASVIIVLSTITGITVIVRLRKKKGNGPYTIMYSNVNTVSNDPKVVIVESDGNKTTSRLATDVSKIDVPGPDPESLPDGIQETTKEKETMDEPIVVQVEEEDNDKKVAD